MNFFSDLPHSAVLEKDEMREIPNHMPAPTIMYPTDVVSRGTGNLSERKNDISKNKRNKAVNPLLENQAEREEVSMEKDICRG